MRSAISGRSVKSALSTSMSRRPLLPYLASIALTSDDLPVPRDPGEQHVVGGKAGDELACVLVDRMLLIVDRDELVEADEGADAGPPAGTRGRSACASARRLTLAQLGSATGGGSMASTRSSTASARAISALKSLLTLRTVIGVDRDVIVREVARPDRGRGVAAAECDANADLVLLHHALAIFFAITRGTAAVVNDQHVVEPERNAGAGSVSGAAVLPMAHTMRPRLDRTQKRRS